MKYVPPFGVSVPDASYVNGDPSIGRQGSIPPAAVFENPQREIVNLIADATQTPTDSDLHQTTRAVRDGKLNFCVDSGPLNQLQVTMPGPPIQAYTAGLTIRVLVAHSNTGPTQISVGTLSPTTVKRRDGSELQALDILAGMVATLVCDGTYFQLQNMGAGDGTGGDVSQQLIDLPYVHDTGTPNHLIGVYSPPLANINEGRTVLIKLANNITGPVDFKPNAFATHSVTHPDGSPLHGGEGVVNQIWLLCFDGVQWQVIDWCCGWGAPTPAEPATPAGSGKSLQFNYGTGFPGPLNTMSHLRRIPAMSTNRQVWTYSMFVKRPVVDLKQIAFTPSSSGNGTESWFSAGGAQAGSDFTGMYFCQADIGTTFDLWWNYSATPIAGPTGPANGGGTRGFNTFGVMNDTKWHHFLLVADGALLSAYVDGILTCQGPVSGNAAVNATRPHEIGADADDLGSWYGAMVRMAEIYLLDGYALDWTKFASNVGGVFVPKVYTGPFGVNGSYLNWNDSSAVTAATLGKDWSGNNNNWTPINFNINQVLADYPSLVAAS